MEKLESYTKEALSKIEQSDTLTALDDVRVHYLGKKGLITALLKGLGKLSPEERPKAGGEINKAKQLIQAKIKDKQKALKDKALAAALAKDTIDVTLPGRGYQIGHLHPVTKAMQRVEDYFTQLGFDIVTGQEIESDYYNFDALNIPLHHPARAMHDTFYFDDETLLRTHTSPAQIRYMHEHKPPLRMIAPGRVYRCDSDLTHTPMFHQIEGLLIDEHTTFADLKGVLKAFMSFFFEEDLAMRFRPSYFPFTEPSAEADIACVKCYGKGCRICKNSGWLEVLGCGMVHPNVLKAGNVDPEKYTGFAFGAGIDRLAMLRYEIDDLRLLFENDNRFLKQF